MCFFGKQRELSDYDTITCINFIRAEVAVGNSPLSALANGGAERPWEKDEYMHPIIAEDPLLFYDFDQGVAEAQDRLGRLQIAS